MVSAAERLASNMDMSVFARATELKKRLWFVIGALIVYRIGCYIPIPGIDPLALKQIFEQQAGGLLGMFNMFSGGSLERMTIFALAVMPYITSSIIMQILGFAVPQLAEMKKEGEAGRRKINQYTRYGTVILATVHAYGIAVWLEGMGNAVIEPGFFFRFTAIVTLVGGTMFLMWLGEQMTARGIGNGISLLIFAGIVAGLPEAVSAIFDMGRRGEMSSATVMLIVILALALVAMIVFFERAYRKIIVQYPKRQVGNKMFGGDQSHIPLKLNTAGVIPPIFASSILLFPLTIAGFYSANAPEWLTIAISYLGHGQPVYMVLYAVIIIFFCFFYTSIMFNPDETSQNLKRNGGFVPGIRPGKNTSEYLDHVLTRLTVVGGLYLAFVCAMPELLIAKYNVPFYLGGTSLLIVVNVMMDFVAQVQSHLFAHQYEGLIQKANLKGKGKGRPRRK